MSAYAGAGQVQMLINAISNITIITDYLIVVTLLSYGQ